MGVPDQDTDYLSKRNVLDGSIPVAIQLSCLISNFCHDAMLWHEGT